MASRGPDLKKYMDKRLQLSLNGGRKVEGVLRGYDQFMNLVLDNTVEQLSSGEGKQIGMVVCGVLRSVVLRLLVSLISCCLHWGR
jgi:small nuclear ribonucleoprotein G